MKPNKREHSVSAWYMINYIRKKKKRGIMKAMKCLQWRGVKKHTYGIPNWWLM